MIERSGGAVGHLLKAAQLEIVAARRDDAKTADKATLTGGERIAGAEGSRYEYRFACRFWPASFDDVDLVIRPASGRGEWVPAEVTSGPDGRRRVVTETDLGAQPPNLQVREDDAAGWEKLAARLQAALDKPDAADVKAADWVLGAGRPALGTEHAVAELVQGWDLLTLNPEQRTAVERALGSDVLFLWGPPGTGKTDVVSRIVEGCYRQGLSVLFLAPTNVAVDQALQRICRLLEPESGFDEGLVQRAGKIALPTLAASYGDRIRSEEIAERLSAELKQEVELLARQTATVAAQTAARRWVETLEQQRDTASNQWQALDRRGVQLTGLAAQAEADIAHLTDEATRLESGFVLRKQSRLDRLAAQLDQARSQLSVHQRQSREVAASRTDAHRAYETAVTTLGLPENNVTGLPSTAELRQHERDLAARTKQVDERGRKVIETVRDRCRVMGATVAKAIVSQRLLQSVDVVVIDEAGMVDLPSAWYAAGLAGRRLIVAGDFRQLPAVTKGVQDRKASPDDRRHAADWTARDAFHAAGIAHDGAVAERDSRLVSLRTQYRMREPICQLVNAVAYPDSPLHTGRDDRAPLADLSGLLDSALVLVDTSTRRITHHHRGEAHLANEVHEALIHEIIRALQYDGALPGRKHGRPEQGHGTTDRLAVIAPYRKQVKNLAASIKYRFGESHDGLADTVHRFQGSQRPIVIFDTVAGAGTKPGQFYEGTELSSTTCRLLNVGLSRAQDHLIVLADVEFLRSKLTGGPALRMLDHLEQHATRWPVDELIPIREASDLGRMSADELERPAFFPADEVTKAVEWDIERARKNVEIYCAFLGATAVARWLRRLQHRVDAGVTVTVYTRPGESGSAGDGQRTQIDRLRAAGCDVQTRDRMHEKVLILDSEVLWHGSLNLLSHTGSRDLMMRLTSASACERVRRILDSAREDRPARTWNTGRPGNAPAPAPPDSSSETTGAGTVVDGRLFLNVPFDDKDTAKRIAQARWDRERKLWHVDAAVYADPAKPEHDLIKRWLP
ncbi:AAA domain-containing protein [Catenulispora pinisilvae]|uniref:AAA domain-containing protein n=1 Tax=Catenulispora pinisilvae TaxID=2705253 RepID=UPI0018913DD4|nr:AAA domain-containing protein [Catenulispora pinisilvae]